MATTHGDTPVAMAAARVVTLAAMATTRGCHPGCYGGVTPLVTPVATRREKIERRQQEVETELKMWDPHNDPNAQGDAFKTLFVARVNYDTTESKLRREFEVYGPIKRIYMVYNKRSGKPRGYAFIEYEHERDMHCEYPPPQHPFPPYNRMSNLLTTTVRSLGPSRARTPQGPWDRHGGTWGPPRAVGIPMAAVTFAPIPRRDRERERERERRERSRERERRRSRSRERRRRTRSREKEERERKRGGSRDRSKERDRKRRSRSRDRKRDRDRDRDKKDEGPESLEPPEELGGAADSGPPDGLGSKGEMEDKGRDRDRERRRGHRERDRRRDRDRDRERPEREHKRERERSERRDERPPGSGPEGGDSLGESGSELFLQPEALPAPDGYLGAENGYLLEPPLE
ncbi:PREDICTED: U1 small nuclear ribonucleoprotein 70 kDa-like [Nipponia nippon]|uniref:U1 small nuclear ribonucleoprotein 70 kDa-like n=1 Tax=Nipponia nippon TaxID=128390 RepID=UPI000510F61E|nr:PREDICTED: U1 small nuclear ribonucleoprotein 70 kDa-like [Nipponia nippon]